MFATGLNPDFKLNLALLTLDARESLPGFFEVVLLAVIVFGAVLIGTSMEQALK